MIALFAALISPFGLYWALGAGQDVLAVISFALIATSFMVVILLQ
jgi:hypothetical protein